MAEKWIMRLWHQQFRYSEWTHISAAAHSELLEGADVIDEQVHQPKFVWKANQDEKAGGVQSNAVRLLLELFVQLQHSVDNSQTAAIKRHNGP